MIWKFNIRFEIKLSFQVFWDIIKIHFIFLQKKTSSMIEICLHLSVVLVKNHPKFTHKFRFFEIKETDFQNVSKYIDEQFKFLHILNTQSVILICHRM